VRHIVDTAVKRRLVDDKTAPADLVRVARAALARELRERDTEGLRPRVRALGGGHYATVDRKLDPELAQAEKELADRAARLRDATRAAVRRRLGRMAPAAFEALGRTLCDKLGVTGLELVRRGEGVTYWGGTRPSGVATVRTLVAFRPGEGEVNRRAIGELRAGLAAKGYDEGLLFAAGRPNGEALAELKNGGVTLYDGAALAQLLIKHGLGVRRVVMPVDYLDLELFTELTEG
jgi:Restriction endonuclease